MVKAAAVTVVAAAMLSGATAFQAPTMIFGSKKSGGGSAASKAKTVKQAAPREYTAADVAAVFKQL
jgi:hypothetical protein